MIIKIKNNTTFFRSFYKRNFNFIGHILISFIIPEGVTTKFLLRGSKIVGLIT